MADVTPAMVKPDPHARMWELVDKGYEVKWGRDQGGNYFVCLDHQKTMARAFQLVNADLLKAARNPDAVMVDVLNVLEERIEALLKTPKP